MKKQLRPVFFTTVIGMLFIMTGVASGLERGAILYHSSKNDMIYGREDRLILPDTFSQLAFRDMKSGHVGLYIGDNRIIHAVLPSVEETESVNFIPKKDYDEGCRYIGAKVPSNYSDTAAWPQIRKDQLILLAKEQVGAAYDVQFANQKGPRASGFTCVGLVEYLFEQVGYDITPAGHYKSGTGGRSFTQIYNSEITFWRDWPGVNTFSQAVEFSKFEHPLAEVLNIGVRYQNDRYMFFPYTQYLQVTTTAVQTDIPVSGGTGKDDSKAGISCFIATAAYGSYEHPHVQIFRTLRDRHLLSSEPGRAFVAAYYRYSPPLADLIRRHDALRAAARVALLPFFALSVMVLWLGPVPTMALFAGLLLLAGRAVHGARKRKLQEPPADRQVATAESMTVESEQGRIGRF